MKKMITYFALAFALTVVTAAPGYAGEPLQGLWTGDIDMQGKWVVINANLNTQQEKLAGTLDMPLLRQMGIKLTAASLSGSDVHFEVATDTVRYVFDGQVADGTMIGKVRQGEQVGTFRLARIVKLDNQTLDDYRGVYRISDDRSISIIRVDARDKLQRLNFLDVKTGRWGRLLPAATDSFFAGPGLLSVLPVDIKIKFIKNEAGKTTGLIYQATGAPAVTAAKLNIFTEEDVQFSNGEAKLSGTLVLPVTPGPHPAIVISHGYGPENRNVYRHFANLFAASGVAVLTYDKRGVGGSTGNWLQASFDDLAGDVMAAYQLLKSRKEVNPRKVGLWGPSEGGWIAPLAASRLREVAFVIVVSAAAVPPAQQEIYRVEQQLRADGFSEKEIGEAVAFVRQQFEVARTGEGMDPLLEVIEASEKKPWFAYVSPAYSLDVLRRAWAQELTFDPVPVWEKITCPVLALYGEVDHSAPIQPSIAIIDQALKKAGNKDYSLRIIPKANNTIWESETGSQKEFAKIKRFAPGYPDAMIAWVLKHTSGSAPTWRLRRTDRP